MNTQFLRRFHWWILILQAAALGVILWHGGYLSYRFDGDEPSYLLFDFSSLQAVLGNHRTAGLPLVLKFYGLFFDDFRVWPSFQMVFYVLSIFFLHGSFLQFGFGRILSLIVASCLLWDKFFFEMFGVILTETLAMGFLNLTVGSMLCAIRWRSWKSFLALGVSTFLVYQIRPGLAFVPILVPFWAIGASILRGGFESVRMWRMFVSFSTPAWLPLLAFCLLRLIIVGQFAIASYSGIFLAGHAAYYLDEDNLNSLSGESRVIAEEILKRKRQHSFPNNLSPFSKRVIPHESKYLTQLKCFNWNVMSAWLVAIKHKMGKEPFDDPSKNIEAWKHRDTLSGFFSISDVEVSRVLTVFAKDILRQKWKQYLSWIVMGSVYQVAKYTWGIMRYEKTTWFAFVVVMGLLMRPVISWRNRDLAKGLLARWNREVLFMTLLAVSVFSAGLLLTVALAIPTDRYLGLLSVYGFPAVTLWAFPPAWGCESEVSPAKPEHGIKQG